MRSPDLIRHGSIVAGIILLFMSMLFSANGLGFVIDNRGAVAAGWAFAVVFTIIEFVFNEEGTNHNFTIVIMGFLCYVYGITTNFIGLMAWSGITNMDSIWDVAAQNPFRIIVPAVLSLVLELGAEPLILWGLTGEAKDFLSGLLGNVGVKRKSGGVPQPPRRDDFGGK